MKKTCEHVKWYHRLFIPFMPDFWERMPEEKYGHNWAAIVIHVYLFRSFDKRVGNYNSLQLAYVKARWAAYWADRFSRGNYKGIGWKTAKITDHE